jgi:predicted alpha/beta superfamily hydrolase
MRQAAVSLTLVGMLAGGAGVSAGVAQQPPLGAAPPVTLPNTHQHILRSRVNGRAYLIQVALPSALVNAKPGDPTRYPTLYLLDGVWDFPLLFSNMQFASMVQPTRTILVGVTAADSQWKWRGTDYTPPLATADSVYFKDKSFPAPLVGGATQFLRVLKEEVIPLIDSAYRTSGDRGIEGTSFGGLFVAYAMLEEPDLFTRYAMISPSLWYPWGRETGSILAREPAFAKQHATFPKIVYVSVGSEEIPGAVAMSAMRFVDQLCSSMRSGYYKGLDLGFEVLTGQPHGSPAARTRVLAALYSADSTGIKPGRGAMSSCR